MRAGFEKWWLLPFGIMAASILVAAGIVVFGPAFVGRSTAEVAQQAPSEPTALSEPTEASEPAKKSEPITSTMPVASPSPKANPNCSVSMPTDYACYQDRYRDLVHGPGVQTAFDELRREMTINDFVRSNCHQMTHVIGRAAAEVYGDIPSTYGQVDNALASFCGSGYYHGAIETVVAKMGADRVLNEADTLCADLGEGQKKYSVYHYNCAHGLGHGFMGLQENELFESLETCDTLKDGWERTRCYGGVFMENVVAKDNSSHPSKYLKAGRPLYPCDIVEDRYKNECYQRQSSYALETQSNDFARVFELCATEVERDFRSACYQGLGWDAYVKSLNRGVANVNESTNMLCMLGNNYEAQFNCIVGAVEYMVRHYYGDGQARTFCESYDSDLRTMCLQEVQEYYRSLQSPLER